MAAEGAKELWNALLRNCIVKVATAIQHLLKFLF